MRRFEMYHASPAFRHADILRFGLKVRMPPFRRSFWQPTVPVLYLTSTVEIAKEYANHAYHMHKTNAVAWDIWRIVYEFGEFPIEPQPDLEWGLPGTYYITVPIPPEHVALLETYYVKDVIRARSNSMKNLPRVDYDKQ